MYFTITFAEENDFFLKHSHVEVLVMANTIHAPQVSTGQNHPCRFFWRIERP